MLVFDVDRLRDTAARLFSYVLPLVLASGCISDRALLCHDQVEHDKTGEMRRRQRALLQRDFPCDEYRDIGTTGVETLVRGCGKAVMLRCECSRIEQIDTCTEVCSEPACRIHAWYVDGRSGGGVVLPSQTHVLDN